MTTSHATRWITPDLMDVTAVSVPQTFQLQAGSFVDITLPDGRTGRLTVIGEPKPDHGRGRWACVGSKYDGREFDLSWEPRSDISALGHLIMVPLRMIVVRR